jgi:Protein of unknown function (DUF1349)
MRPLAFAPLGALLASLALAAPLPKAKEGTFYKPGWDKPIDPDGDCKFVQKRPELRIELPAKDHDFDPGRERLNAPRLLRPVVGNFSVTVRVRADFHATRKATAAGATAFTAGGLFIEAADRDRHRLIWEFGVTRRFGDPEAYVAYKVLSFAHPKAGAVSTWNESWRLWPLKKGAREAYLRIERRGRMVPGEVSPDGKKWTKLSPFGMELPRRVKVGLIACNTSAKALTVTFDKFELTKLDAETARK